MNNKIVFLFLVAIQVMIQGNNATWEWQDGKPLQDYIEEGAEFKGEDFIKRPYLFPMLCAQGYENNAIYKKTDVVPLAGRRSRAIKNGSSTKEETLLFCAVADKVINYYFGRGPIANTVSVYTGDAGSKDPLEPYGIIKGIPNV